MLEAKAPDETRTEPLPRRRIYYGWWVAIAGLVILSIQVGTGFYSFGVFFRHIEDEFVWDRAAVSMALSITMLTTAVVGVPVGRMANRVRASRIALPGVIAIVAGFVLLSRVNSLWQFYLLYGLLGVGMGVAGVVLISNTAANWFHRRRGLVLGITMAGINIGTLIGVPLTRYLVDLLGWRHAYLALGLIALVVELPLVLLVLRTRPGQRELEESGEIAVPNRLESGTAPATAFSAGGIYINTGSRLSQALKSGKFWLVMFGFSLAGLSSAGIVIHQIPYLTDMEIPESTAAYVLALSMGFGVIGKMGFGHLSDRVHIRYVTMACFGFQAVGVLLLMRVENAAMIWPFVVVYGIASGGTATLMAIIIADLYGMSSFGMIYAVATLIYITGNVVGPPLAGRIFDVTGSYTIAFEIFFAVYVVSLVAVYFVWGARLLPASKKRSM